MNYLIIRALLSKFTCEIFSPVNNVNEAISTLTTLYFFFPSPTFLLEDHVLLCELLQMPSILIAAPVVFTRMLSRSMALLQPGCLHTEKRSRSKSVSPAWEKCHLETLRFRPEMILSYLHYIKFPYLFKLFRLLRLLCRGFILGF